MGATLATRLAELHGDRIAGLVLVNPAFGLERVDAKFAPLLAKVVRSRPPIAGDIKKPGVREPGYDRMPLVAFASMQRLWRVTVADLSKVTAPIRLYRSVQDHVLDPLSARLLKSGTTATTVDEVLLEDSYHVATLDYDAERIFAGSLEFIRAVSAGVSGESQGGSVGCSEAAGGRA
jgi:carboxylesterase